jgi:hypothetical protein
MQTLTQKEVTLVAGGAEGDVTYHHYSDGSCWRRTEMANGLGHFQLVTRSVESDVFHQLLH